MSRHKQEKPTKETAAFFQKRKGFYTINLGDPNPGCKSPGNYWTQKKPSLDEYDSYYGDLAVDSSTGLLTMEWRYE